MISERHRRAAPNTLCMSVGLTTLEVRTLQTFTGMRRSGVGAEEIIHHPMNELLFVDNIKPR